MNGHSDQTPDQDDPRQWLRHALRGAEAQPAALPGDVRDWPALIATAEAARVAPLLYRIWRDDRRVPPNAMHQLRGAYLACAHRSIVLLHGLAGAIAALQGDGVDVLVLKGAALAEMVYRNVAVRPLADVDVLVRPAQLAAARTTLARLGFATPRPETRPGSAAAFENELMLIKRGPIDIPVEIHWSLFDSPHHQERIDLEPCWASAVSLRLGDVTARALDPLHLLLHLCGHLVLHHGGDDLLWEQDIVEVLRAHGPVLDWPLLLRRAVEWDLVLSLQRILLPLAAAQAIVVPATALAALRQLEPSAAERRVVGYLTAPARSVAQRAWSDLHGLPGWRPRLAYAWTHLFPSPAYMRARYNIRNPALLPLFYPYRWLRGLRR